MQFWRFYRKNRGSRADHTVFCAIDLPGFEGDDAPQLAQALRAMLLGGGILLAAQIF